jgi:hypothetical protein
MKNYFNFFSFICNRIFAKCNLFESGEKWIYLVFASFENGGGLGYEKVANPFKTELILLEQVNLLLCLQLEQHLCRM